MKSNFVIWTHKLVKDACALYKLTGVQKDYQLRKGVPRSGTFGDQAMFDMDPDLPNDTLLTDSLFNTDLLIVGSARLKTFFQERAVPKVEYLPVTIINHKRKVASTEYSIINPIDPIECLDLERSEVRWHEFDKSTIDGLVRLSIDESKVDEERVLFRPKFFHRVILIRREVAEMIDAIGFTGIRWVEPEEYSR